MTKTWAQLLSAAILIAATAHKGVIDKNGRPYILHPMWVMNELLRDGEDDYTAALGVLHDAIEDNPVYCTDERLVEAGFTPEFLHDLNLLTHQKSVPYDVYIQGLAIRRRTRAVKLKDLTHNSMIFRMKGLEEKDQKRLAKYMKAYQYLKQVN